MLSIHNIVLFFYIKLKSPEFSNTLIRFVRWHQKDKMPKAVSSKYKSTQPDEIALNWGIRK